MSVVHASIAEAPSCEALSYCWGDQKDDLLILVNGDACYIKSNLCGTLESLRLANKPRMLWIDVFCINQIDIGERNVQLS